MDLEQHKLKLKRNQRLKICRKCGYKFAAKIGHYLGVYSEDVCKPCRKQSKNKSNTVVEHRYTIAEFVTEVRKRGYSTRLLGCGDTHRAGSCLLLSAVNYWSKPSPVIIQDTGIECFNPFDGKEPAMACRVFRMVPDDEGMIPITFAQFLRIPVQDRLLMGEILDGVCFGSKQAIANANNFNDVSVAVKGINADIVIDIDDKFVIPSDAVKNNLDRFGFPPIIHCSVCGTNENVGDIRKANSEESFVHCCQSCFNNLKP